jgi:hypothetical protein
MPRPEFVPPACSPRLRKAGYRPAMRSPASWKPKTRSLPCLTYPLPLSVASINQAVYDNLDTGLRQAVDTAGRQTETELWSALSTRLQENCARMRQNGVTIDSNPAAAIVAAFHDGAAAAQRARCARSGAICNQILGAFKAGKP